MIAFLGGGLLHPLRGNGYQLWSGILSDVGELTLIVAVCSTAWALYRHHRCGHCWRLGRHVVQVSRPDGQVETHLSCRWHLDEDHAARVRRVSKTVSG